MRANAGKDIRERSLAYAVRILRVVRALPTDTAGYVIGKQLALSGTSVGANVEEAKAAHSKADFVRRMNIARAEARESLYWLRLAADARLVDRGRLAPLLKEADEIVSVLTAIVKNSRAQ